MSRAKDATEPRFIIAINAPGQVAPAWVHRVCRGGGYYLTRNKEKARIMSAGITEGAMLLCAGAARAAGQELVAVPA